MRNPENFGNQLPLATLIRFTFSSISKNGYDPEYGQSMALAKWSSCKKSGDEGLNNSCNLLKVNKAFRREVLETLCRHGVFYILEGHFDKYNQEVLYRFSLHGLSFPLQMLQHLAMYYPTASMMLHTFPDVKQNLLSLLKDRLS